MGAVGGLPKGLRRFCSGQTGEELCLLVLASSAVLGVLQASAAQERSPSALALQLSPLSGPWSPGLWRALGIQKPRKILGGNIMAQLKRGRCRGVLSVRTGGFSGHHPAVSPRRLCWSTSSGLAPEGTGPARAALAAEMGPAVTPQTP